MEEKAGERVKLRFNANTPSDVEKGERAELLRFLHDGKVDFYGYREVSVPDVLLGKPESQVRIFRRDASGKQVGDFPVNPYKELMDISGTEADACFLDREALMVLFAGFPVKPGCVLVRFSFRLSWIFAVPGLLRRILKKEVKLGGILSLKSGIAVASGAEVPFRRPVELAGDDVPSISFVQHAVEWLETRGNYQVDIVVYLQVTDVFRKKYMLDETVGRLLANPDLDTVFVGHPTHKNFWVKDGGGLPPGGRAGG